MRSLLPPSCDSYLDDDRRRRLEVPFVGFRRASRCFGRQPFGTERADARDERRLARPPLSTRWLLAPTNSALSIQLLRQTKGEEPQESELRLRRV